MTKQATRMGSDLLTLLRAHIKLVAAGTLGGVALAVLYVLLAPKWYEATLVVIPSQRTQSASATLAAALPGLASLALPAGTDVDRIDAVLNTNTVADEVIAKFGLMKLYDQQHIEHARKALRKHCATETTRKAGIVMLTCEDKSAQRARDMAAFFGEVGNRVFGRVSGSAALEEMRFLETRVSEARRDLEQASQRLKAFQEKHRIVDITEQSRAVISTMASLQGELIAKQVQLSYLSGYSSSTEGSVVQLQKQIAVIRHKLEELEHARAAAPAEGAPAPAQPGQSGTFFPGAMAVPELQFELEPLMREQKVQETVLLLLTQRYETAKIDAARDTSTFQVLDPPTLPTYPSSPRKLRCLALGAGLGAAASVLWVLGLAVRRQRKALARAPAPLKDAA